MNLTDDPWFTDGKRLVIWLSKVPVSSQMVEDLDWNDSADAVRESRCEEHMVPALRGE